MNLRNLFLLCLIALAIIYWSTRSPVKEGAPPPPQETETPPPPLASAPVSSAPVNPADSKTLPPIELPIFNETQIKEIREHIQMLLKRSQSAQRGNFDEIERFSTDIFFSGMPTPKFKNIIYGFLEPYLVEPSQGEDPRRLDSTFLKPLNQLETFPVPQAAFSLSSLKQYCQKGCSATANTYEIILAVNLDADPDLDVWTTDESREIKHVHDDLESASPKPNVPPSPEITP